MDIYHFIVRESFECCKGSSHLISFYIEAIQTIYLVTKWGLMSIRSFKKKEKVFFLKTSVFDRQGMFHWRGVAFLEVARRMDNAGL